jgi:hypothetical protein
MERRNKARSRRPKFAGRGKRKAGPLWKGEGTEGAQLNDDPIVMPE